jgi:protein-disulfide isomerase
MMRNCTLALAFLALLHTHPVARAQAAEPQVIPVVPSAPLAKQGAPPAAPTFPPPDPKNFSAATPTRETVDAFLHETWGYDPDRIWSVAAIQKTDAPGVSRIVVLAAQKSQPQQSGQLVFFTTPDGQHLIASDVLPFGAHPFAARRALLQAGVNGPSKGSATRTFLLVEFADFQCPHCKEVQPNIQQLLSDFPQAHFVYQNFPLVSIHSEAYKASSWSVCVEKLNGTDAFFRFADAVYADQAELRPESSTEALRTAATKIGADAAKVEACSATPEAKAAVDASLDLGARLDVNQTPTLYINGRSVPLGGMSYEQIKQMVTYQFSLDK